MMNLKDAVIFLKNNYSTILSKPSVRSVRDFLSGVVAKSDDHKIRLEIVKFSAWMSVRSHDQGGVIPWYVFFKNPDTEESFQFFIDQIDLFFSNETFVVMSYLPLQIEEDIEFSDFYDAEDIIEPIDFERVVVSRIEIEKHGSEDIFYIKTRTHSGEYSYFNFVSNSLEEIKKFCFKYFPPAEIL